MEKESVERIVRALNEAGVRLAPKVFGTFVGFDDLITLKQNAGRAQDLADVEQLRAIREQRGDEGDENNELDQWDRGWDEHRMKQLLRLADLPFPEKLAWLEEAQKLARALSSGGERPSEPSVSPASADEK